MFTILIVSLFLSTVVNAYTSELKEGTMLVSYETIDEKWEATFVPYRGSMSVSNVKPQVLSYDYKACHVNYTCQWIDICIVRASAKRCGEYQLQLVCRPVLSQYQSTFLGHNISHGYSGYMVYENLTELWCEKVTTNGVVLSSQFELNDVIIKNSCFLVVHSYEIEQPNVIVLFLMLGTCIVFIIFLAIFVKKELF